MKRMKKIFAVILSLAMVMGMSLTAFADDGPHIKITGLPTEAGIKIKSKKIVSPNKATPTDTKGWKLEDNTGLNDDDLQKLIGATDKGTAGVINTDTNVANTIAKVNFSNTEEKTLASTDFEADGSYLINNVNPGLYVIEAQAEGYTFIRMLAFVDFKDRAKGTAVDETVVAAKGEKLQVGKEITDNNSTSVTSGDPVPFKITAKYPYYDATTTNKKFIITDTVTGGSITEDGIKIQIGTDSPIEVKQSGDIDNYSVVLNKNGFTVNFTKYEANKAGKDVIITYNVTTEVTKEVDKLTNNVTSTTTVPDNDPSSETGEKDNTTETEVISPSVKATVKKVEKQEAGATEDPTALQGAKFSLYVVVDTKPEGEAFVYNSTDNKIKKAENLAATGESWVKFVKESDETDKDGKATFYALDAEKTYYVVETQAPTGYSLNDTAYKLTGATIKSATVAVPKKDANGNVVMNASGNVIMQMVNEATDFTGLDDIVGKVIPDTKLSSLPSTGGIGTTIFTIGGCAIMIIAAALFFASRRKEAK